MILAIALNPSLDRTIFLDELKVGDSNRVIRTETDAGGKGINLARIAAEMGANAMTVGYLGGGTGAFVRKVLEREEVPSKFIEVMGETRTNVCIETMRGDPPTMLNERGPHISGEQWAELQDLVQESAAASSWVALGGSIPPGIPADCMRTLAEIAHSRGAKVLLDADGEAFVQGMRAGPEFIKPNIREAERYLARTIPDLESACEATAELHRDGTDIVVLSRGAQGAILCSQEGLFNAAPPKVEQRSTIGSGDSLVGAMLAALTQGLSLETSLRWGVAAGAATAMTDGASIGKKIDFERILPSVVMERCG